METMKRVEKRKRKTRKVEDDIWWSGKGFLTHREKMLVPIFRVLRNHKQNTG